MVHRGGRVISFNAKQKTGLVLGPTLFLLVLLFGSFEGLSAPGQAILASTLWIATWWITEAISISATALLPVILFPLSGGLNIQLTTEAYSQPLIFLFIGGFMIAMAIERWHLHKRIALNIIRIVGTNSSRIILGFMMATAFLSMWISNTATTLMMMPIGIAIITALGEFMERNGQGAMVNSSGLDKALMLAIAYSASIGGMATLIGTPTNVVFSGVVQQIYGMEISFAQWMLFGLPVAMVLLVICWIYLVRVAFKLWHQEIPGGPKEINKQLAELGPMTVEEKRVLIVFAITAFSWITRSFILNQLIPGLNDTIIAIFGALLLFLIPAKKPGTQLLNWESAVKLPWGIILLFGGGLSLAAGFTESGLAYWLGTQLNLLQGISLIFILVFIIAAVNFLTEITSNVATASMILPILAALAVGIDVHPFGLMIAATAAASCAFMLPVATPPNAVVFGSGYLQMKDMVRTGIWMNIISIVLLTIFVYYLLPWIWGFQLNHFPEILK